MTIFLCILLLSSAALGVKTYQDVQAEQHQLTLMVESKGKDSEALRSTANNYNSTIVSDIDGVTVINLGSK